MPHSVLTKSWTEQYLDTFRALSEPLRLQIIAMFDEHGSCACTTLGESLPISKTTISYHVKILRQAGLIDVSKEGRFYHYMLRREAFEELVPGLLDRLIAEHAVSHGG